MLKGKKCRKKFPVLTEYLQVMRSEAMFLIMAQLTGLKLHALAPESGSEEEPSDSEQENEDGEGNNVSEQENEDGEGRNDSEQENKDGEGRNDSEKEGRKTLNKIMKRRKRLACDEENNCCNDFDEELDGLKQPWSFDIGCYADEGKLAEGTY